MARKDEDVAIQYFDTENNTLTLDQVKGLLNMAPLEGLRILVGEYDEDINELVEKFDCAPTFNGVKVGIVYEIGGREGDGEKVVRVLSVELPGESARFFRVTGSYFSEMGTEYDEEVQEVFGRPVTEIRYFSQAEF